MGLGIVRGAFEVMGWSVAGDGGVSGGYWEEKVCLTRFLSLLTL